MLLKKGGELIVRETGLADDASDDRCGQVKALVVRDGYATRPRGGA